MNVKVVDSLNGEHEYNDVFVMIGMESTTVVADRDDGAVTVELKPDAGVQCVDGVMVFAPPTPITARLVGQMTYIEEDPEDLRELNVLKKKYDAQKQIIEKLEVEVEDTLTRILDLENGKLKTYIGDVL